MTLTQRQAKIVASFESLGDWEERYKRLIDLGKALPELPANKRLEEYRVKGCQSQVWLHAKLHEGRVLFEGDSDALLVKGLVALVLEVYSSGTPQEILATPPDFIREIGLESKLSPSRANGVFSMIKQIKYYALAFQALTP